MRTNKRIVSALLSAALIAAFPAQAMASGPGVTEPEKYDAETLARLQDDVLEYEELPELVHEYNAGMQVMWDSFDRMKQDYVNVTQELKSQRKSYKDGAERDKEALDHATNPNDIYQLTVSYMTNKGLDKAIQSVITTYSDVVDNFNSDKNTQTLRQYERQAVSGAQSLMIAYSSIEAQKGILEKMKAMYDAKYALVTQQAGLGTATEADLLSAQSSVLSAEASLASLSSTQDDLRRKLIVMTGWPADANPEIRPIPTSDLNRIAAMSLEEDTKKAIGNNAALISVRHTGTNGSTAEKRLHLMSVEEAEQKMTIKMQELYNDVLKKKAEYEAALTGYESAVISKQSADTMHQMGMVGETEYIGLQLQYLQKMSEKEAADIALFQAMETYDWAVKGLASYE